MLPRAFVSLQPDIVLHLIMSSFMLICVVFLVNLVWLFCCIMSRLFTAHYVPRFCHVSTNCCMLLYPFLCCNSSLHLFKSCYVTLFFHLSDIRVLSFHRAHVNTSFYLANITCPPILAMFAGRASASGATIGPSAVGAKGGKFFVEELYGFNKKPKVNKGNSGKSDKSNEKKETKDKEESMLASQILEAARRLMERRRLEIYLKECDVIMEHSNMPYR